MIINPPGGEMKTKRLKGIVFEYKNKGFPIQIRYPDNSAYIHLTKKEALALLRFLLENLELSLNKINSLGYILDKRWNVLLKEKK